MFRCNFIKHLLHKHSLEGENFTCVLCSQGHKNKDELEYHMRTHIGVLDKSGIKKKDEPDRPPSAQPDGTEDEDEPDRAKPSTSTYMTWNFDTESPESPESPPPDELWQSFLEGVPEYVPRREESCDLGKMIKSGIKKMSLTSPHHLNLMALNRLKVIKLLKRPVTKSTAPAIVRKTSL